MQLLGWFSVFFLFSLYLKQLSLERKSLVSKRCPDAVVGMGTTPGMGGLAGEPFMYLVLIPWYVQIGKVLIPFPWRI